jgi:ParB family chromosome partitioning protein
MRNDLTVLEQGEHLARRQELIGFKQGDNRFTIDRGETVSPLKTTAEIAHHIGLTERSAQQRIQAARNIVPEVKDAIRDTEIANSTTQNAGFIANLNGNLINGFAELLVTLDRIFRNAIFFP